MLTQLRLRDFVLIDRAEFSPAEGFCALTGETGVGKSVLVDALSLLCGGRAGPDRVRPGAERAEIEAVFLLPQNSAVRARLAENGLDDGDELIARRVVARTARNSRAFLNGRAAPLSQMAETVSALVDICGQHAHHILRNPSAHGAVLDGFANCGDLAERVEAQWRKWRADADACALAEKNSAETSRRRTELEEDLAELGGLDFSPEKWTEMNRRLTRLEHVEDLAAGCNEASRLFGDEDGGARTALSRARRILESLAEKDGALRGPAGLAAAALDSADEATRELDAYAAALKSDPEARAEAERFILEAHRLARKHRLADAEGLGDLAAELEAEFAELSRGADLAGLQARAEESRGELDSLCGKLTAIRVRAAKDFGAEATARVRALAMPEARIEARLTRVDPPRAFGAERAEFLVSTRADAEAGALARVASGGELSRIGLAMQATARRSRPTPTVIFDEIDAGVGGAAADAVGAALAELGGDRQVLCVTHLAQVAARAEGHWRVRAVRRDGRRSAAVERVGDEERVLEIARMLGGDKITEAAKRHAAEMLGRS